MSAVLDLSLNSPYNDRNQKLSFLIDISLVNMTPGDIMGMMLVLNDEDMSPNEVNNMRYYKLDFSTIVFINGVGQLLYQVPSDPDFIRNGDEYTARAMLEHNNGSLYKSNTVVDIVPFTIPDRPSFTRVDPSILYPLVDAGFDLQLLGIEDNTYWNGGSPLLSVKWIWSKVKGDNTGMIEFKTVTYDPAVNTYRIDVSDSMFSDGIIDVSDAYEVSVVVRNLAGESLVSQGLVLNALNIPDRPLGLLATVDTAQSNPNTAIVKATFHYPLDYANSNYQNLTYRVFWDISPSVGLDSSYTDFTGTSQVFNGSASYIYVNLSLPGSIVYNQTVYLKVQALNVNGGSPLSNMQSIAPYSPCAAPTNLRVKLGPLDASKNTATDAANDANDGSSNAIVYFTAPSPLLLGSNSVFVRYEVLDSSNNILAYNTNSSDNFVSLTGLTNFSQYNISVRVQSSYNNITYDGISSSSINIIPFTYPVDVSITNAVEGDTEVLVEWSSSDSYPEFPVYYRVGYKLTNASSYTYAEISDDNTLSDSSFNFTDLINSQEYIFEITPFYIVQQQYYTVEGIWISNGTLKYFGNPTTVTKVPIKNPTLGSINLTANLGPMKSDFSAANYSNQIQNNYDGNNKVVLSWTPPLQTDLSLSQYVSFVKYEIADSNDTIVFTSNDRNQSIYVLTSNNIGNITIQNYVIGRYKIRATVSNGNVERTSEWSDLTANAAPFVYPIDVTIINAIEDDSQVGIEWSDSDSHIGFPIHYRIGYKLSSESSYTYVNINDVSYNFIDLVNSYSYDFEITPFYTVQGENYYGNSTSVTKTPIAVPSLGAISFTSYLGPMKADLSAANYSADVSLGYDGDSKVVLTWVQPSDSDLGLTTDVSFVNYEIADSNDTILYTTTNLNEVLYVLTSGVVNYQIEQYKIRATVSNGNVSRTSEWSDLTANAAPFVYPIDSTIVSAVEDDAVVAVAWTASDSYDGFPVHYRIGYKLSSSAEYTYSEVDDVSHNFVGLTNSFSYDFEITPFYTVDGENYYNNNSATVTKTPLATPLLGEIQLTSHLGPMKADLSAANYSVDVSLGYDGDSKVVLTWVQPSDSDLGLTTDVSFVNYEIADSNDNILYTLNDLTTVLQVVTSGVVNYQFEQYKIRATVSNGNVSRTSEWSDLTSNAAPFVYPIVSTIVSAVEDDAVVAVAWTASDSYDGFPVHYRIGYKLSSSVEYIYSEIDDVSHNFDGLTNSFSYDFEITPFYTVDGENYYNNNPATVTRVPVERPSLGDIEFTAHFGPMKLDLSVANYAEDASYNGDDQVVLTWVPPVDENLGLSIDVSFVNYEIADSNGNILVTLTDRNIDLYVLTSANGVLNGTARQYKIRANVTNGLNTFTSLYSNLTTSIAPFTFPSAPTGVGAVGDDNNITVSWTAVGTQYTYTPAYYVQGDGNAAEDVNGTSIVRTYTLYGKHSGDVATFIEAPTVDPLVTARYYSSPVAWESASYKSPDAITNFQILAGPLASLTSAASILSSVTNGYDGSNSVVLTWDQPTDIELGLGNGIRFLKYVVTTPDNNDHVITDRATLLYVANAADSVADGVSKNYSIKVYTDVSYVTIDTVVSTISSDSNTSFTFPPALTGLGVVSDDTVANVSWNTFSHPIASIDKKFLVEWKLVSASSWDSSAVLVNLTSYQITGLLNNSSYNVRVTPFITVEQENVLSTNNYYGDAQTDFAYPIGTPIAVENFNVLCGPLDASLNPTPTTDGFNSNSGDNMVTFVWNNPADISSWGNGSSVQFVRFEVELQNTNGDTDICMNFLSTNNGANAEQVVAKFSRMLAGAANNNTSTGLNTNNGALRSYRVRVVTSNNDAAPVFKYGEWSTLISARAFDRPNSVASATFTATSQDQSIKLNWVDLPLQDSYVTRYSIYLDNVLNQTTPDDASSAIIGGLTNGVRYNGSIRTTITAIWDNANALTNNYFSDPLAFSGVPTVTPLAPTIVTDSEIELDRNITFTLDSSVNNSYYLWTLNNYTLTVEDEDLELINIYNVPANTSLFDVSANAWGILANGHMYNFNIVGNYTYNDGSNATFNRTTEATTFTLSPYGKPIINTDSTIIGFNSGDIQINVDPNGRPLENVWLVGIPESLDTVVDDSWNFVYSSELDNVSLTLPTSRYGEEVLQLNDPFQSSGTDAYLKICYIFVSNLRGTSTYEEVGDSTFALP